jgi:hypothetical protein
MRLPNDSDADWPRRASFLRSADVRIHKIPTLSSSLQGGMDGDRINYPAAELTRPFSGIPGDSRPGHRSPRRMQFR